jgi:hypothetical protein
MFNKKERMYDELFYYKQIGCGDMKPISRKHFENERKRFDMHQTVVEKEITENLTYTDTNGKNNCVQLLIKIKANTATAEIVFEDVEQMNNFACPPWLTV